MTDRTLLIEAVDLAAIAVAADPENTPAVTNGALARLRPILVGAGLNPREVEARCDDFIRAVGERVGQLHPEGSA